MNYGIWSITTHTPAYKSKTHHMQSTLSSRTLQLDRTNSLPFSGDCSGGYLVCAPLSDRYRLLISYFSSLPRTSSNHSPLAISTATFLSNHTHVYLIHLSVFLKPPPFTRPATLTVAVFVKALIVRSNATLHLSLLSVVTHPCDTSNL